MQASNYWSSSSFAGNPFYAWYVYFGNGFVSKLGKGADSYARAVRGGW